MAEHWWRAYDGSIDHPKLLKLSDAMHRAWFTLQCIASANGGTLPRAEDIALRLRLKPSKVAEWITALVLAGLIDNDDGMFSPHNWETRQYKSDATDPTAPQRMKRYRANKRNDRNATVTAIRPDTEQIQSRAERAALQTSLEEILGPSKDLSRTEIWLSKGYSETMIIEVVKEVIARGTAVGSLAYFDTMLADRHAKRPETPSERAASALKVDMEKVVAMFVKTGVWSKYAGPEPGMIGCKCPPEILAKHGLSPALRRMDA